MFGEKPPEELNPHAAVLAAIDTELTRRGVEEIEMIPDTIKLAWMRAVEILNDRISPDSFDDIDTLKPVVARANNYTKNKEKAISTDREKIYATVIEAIIFDQIQKGNWFGEDAIAFLTSDYDDYLNGADLAVETGGKLNLSGGHGILLSFDATYSESRERIESKISKFVQKISSGKMGVITFYKSPNGRVRGSVDYVPVLTVGFGKATIARLSELWLKNNEDSNKELSKHPAQKLILEECRVQLESFLNFVNTTNPPNKELLKASLREELEMIEVILEKKKSVYLGNLEDDPVSILIRDASHKLTKTGKFT